MMILQKSKIPYIIMTFSLIIYIVICLSEEEHILNSRVKNAIFLLILIGIKIFSMLIFSMLKFINLTIFLSS